MSEIVPANISTKSTDQKFCFSCGVILHNSAESCPACSAIQPQGYIQKQQVSVVTDSNIVGLPAQHIYCRGCGKPIHQSAHSCPNCGAVQMGGELSTSNGPDRTVAIILALFFGWIGVHKFYLGRIGQGILYLLFSWTFIPAIIAFIEAIIYLTMSEKEFKSNYS